MGGDSLDARAWLVERGAADLGETYLRLAIEGRSHSTVRVRNIRAVIRARHAPISETSVGSPSGGDAEIQAFGLNLDENAPVARTLQLNPRYSVHISPPFGDPYFSGRQTTLVRDEIVTYSILARSTRDHVDWALEVDLAVDGKPKKLLLDNDGQPFRTSPLVGRAKRSWDWAWYDRPDPEFVDITDRDLGGREDEGAPSQRPGSPPSRR